ncbi:lig [Symbiodinium natans]|uniref:Lig protein n=1 Tax=Symbiodinium natans TaxID=878477 RepID=A0A812RTQ1_9DINO|nr:lig [Symbiodinium natans]
MGGTQASFCCCWERPKLPEGCPRNLSPSEEALLASIPRTTTANQDCWEDRQVTLEVGVRNTFIELKEVSTPQRRRSRSLPKELKPCKAAEAAEAAEAPAGHPEDAPQGRHEEREEPPPLDHPFEPFLTYPMVVAERAFMREVRGRLTWRKVPARPHFCRNTCHQCCQLSNDSWRLAACDHRPAEGLPGQVPACRDLDVMPSLEESDWEEDLWG